MKYISATYDKKLLTAEYIAEDGTRYLRSGGTICWRFFNPGNIRPSKTSVCNSLKIGVGDTKSGKFMIFPSEEVGWQALSLLLKSAYKDMEIKNVAKRFAPATDNNDPEKYSKFIVTESGLEGDRHVRDLDEASLERLMEAIKKMEGYYNNKDSRREKKVATTSVIVSDGSKPIVNEKLKVVIDQCTYEWSTNKYGGLPIIAHLAGRGRIDIFATSTKGVDEKIYSSTPGDTSKNILLLRIGSSYTAKTGVHKQGEKSTSIYHVKKGDTLGKIAKKLNTTVTRIADLNKIKNVNILSVGQELKIPDGSALPQTVPSPASNSSRGNQRQTSTGTSDAGYPQANIGTISEQAPWMKVALAEARRWAGKREEDITRVVNYHKEVDVNLNSLVGDSNPWCASFVNYCLVNSEPRFPKSNQPARALSFSSDARFKKLEQPVFGAIAVYGRNGGGHVCFVYALSERVNGNVIVLGGNQDDQINFVDRSNRKLVGYFVPIQYQAQALKEITSTPLLKKTAEEMNSFLDINNPINGSES
ncbi:LysM peptidoglycan-binding domain-containing protein [Rahnella sp. EDr1-12]|uniref:LysM peptidoglycan-binding domain-containing protein n=1 Tax=unclassified Rahnella TaxID=2635087 RepID=UPI003BA8DDEB